MFDFHKTTLMDCRPVWKTHNDTFGRFVTTSKCHRRTDGHWQSCY